MKKTKTIEAHRRGRAAGTYKVGKRKYRGGIAAMARKLLAEGVAPNTVLQTYTSEGTPSMRNTVGWWAQWAAPAAHRIRVNPRPYKPRPNSL